MSVRLIYEYSKARYSIEHFTDLQWTQKLSVSSCTDIYAFHRWGRGYLSRCIYAAYPEQSFRLQRQRARVAYDRYRKSLQRQTQVSKTPRKRKASRRYSLYFRQHTWNHRCGNVTVCKRTYSHIPLLLWGLLYSRNSKNTKNQPICCNLKAWESPKTS